MTKRSKAQKKKNTQSVRKSEEMKSSSGHDETLDSIDSSREANSAGITNEIFDAHDASARSPMVSHEIAYPDQRAAEEDIDFYVQTEPGAADASASAEQHDTLPCQSVRYSAVYERSSDLEFDDSFTHEQPSSTVQSMADESDAAGEVSQGLKNAVPPSSQATSARPTSLNHPGEPYSGAPVQSNSIWRDVQPIVDANEADIGAREVKERHSDAAATMSEARSISPTNAQHTATAEAAPIMDIEPGSSLSHILESMLFRLLQHWEYWTKHLPDWPCAAASADAKQEPPSSDEAYAKEQHDSYQKHLHATVVDSLAVMVLCLVLLPAEAVSMLHRSTFGRIVRILLRIALLAARWIMDSVRLAVWLWLLPLRILSSAFSLSAVTLKTALMPSIQA